jgi:signal transduction histidine kinase
MLTEHRHPEGLGNWIVERPGTKPIAATSFQARTGSIGGSQGIKWQDASGQKMTAYLSFSDVVSDDGPMEIYIALLRDDAAEKTANFKATLSIDFVCHLSSYRE